MAVATELSLSKTPELEDLRILVTNLSTKARENRVLKKTIAKQSQELETLRTKAKEAEALKDRLAVIALENRHLIATRAQILQLYSNLKLTQEQHSED